MNKITVIFNLEFNNHRLFLLLQRILQAYITGLVNMDK